MFSGVKSFKQPIDITPLIDLLTGGGATAPDCCTLDRFVSPRHRATRRVLAFARACPATSPPIPCAAARREQSSPRRCALARRTSGSPPSAWHQYPPARRYATAIAEPRDASAAAHSPPWSRASPLGQPSCRPKPARSPVAARLQSERRGRVRVCRQPITLSLRRSRRGVLPVGAALLSQARPFPVKSRSPVVSSPAAARGRVDFLLSF